MTRLYRISYEVSFENDENTLDAGEVTVSTSGDAEEAIELAKESLRVEFFDDKPEDDEDLYFFIESVELLGEADVEGE